MTSSQPRVREGIFLGAGRGPAGEPDSSGWSSEQARSPNDAGPVVPELGITLGEGRRLGAERNGDDTARAHPAQHPGERTAGPRHGARHRDVVRRGLEALGATEQQLHVAQLQHAARRVLEVAPAQPRLHQGEAAIGVCDGEGEARNPRSAAEIGERPEGRQEASETERVQHQVADDRLRRGVTGQVDALGPAGQQARQLEQTPALPAVQGEAELLETSVERGGGVVARVPRGTPRGWQGWERERAERSTGNAPKLSRPIRPKPPPRRGAALPRTPESPPEPPRPAGTARSPHSWSPLPLRRAAPRG
jgi:hypothetical protein